VFPHAVIDAGEIALMKLMGEDWKLTDSSKAGAVVEEV
jgi:hypothetical protein